MAMLLSSGKIPVLLSTALATALSTAISPPALAHHSSAVFDFHTQLPFEGTVETIRFRNPHVAITLKTVDADGNEKIIDFVEGAPANKLAGSGLRPEMIKPGTHITTTGSPLLDDNSKFFLRSIRLDDGSEF